MKNKLFLSFIVVISMALISNFIFNWLITRDFEQYTSAVARQRIYWLVGSVESSFGAKGWDLDLLNDTVHWSSMLGFDMQVIDSDGKVITQSSDVLHSLDERMRARMKGIVHLDMPLGDYVPYPVNVTPSRRVTVNIRPLAINRYLKEREEVIKGHGRGFIVISIAIAGGGAFILAFLFSNLLSHPLKRLT